MGSVRESKKRRLMSLVDLSAEPWRKAAFYSNSEAMEIVTELYDRWEKGGRVGDPLDYATEEELDRLIVIAEGIEQTDIQDQQVKTFIAAVYGEEALEEMERRRRKERRGIKSVLKKIFFME